MKSKLQFCTVSSTNDTHQIPKTQISVADSLINSNDIVKHEFNSNDLLIK